MVFVHEADRLGLRAALEHLRAAQLQILDENDAVAVGEHVAVGVLDDERGLRRGGCGFARPLVTAGDAFPFVRKFKDFGHFAHRAGRFAHKGTA